MILGLLTAPANEFGGFVSEILIKQRSAADAYQFGTVPLLFSREDNL